MFAFCNILHCKVKGDVRGTVFYVLEADQYRSICKFEYQNCYWEGKNGIGTYLFQMFKPGSLNLTVVLNSRNMVRQTDKAFPTLFNMTACS